MPPDTPVFENRFWLARVWADGESRSQLIGTAFAISPNHLLTCAHVVNEAGGSGPGDRVYVDFPLLETKGSWAVVLSEGWRSVPRETEPQSAGDTAVLRLEDPPATIEPIPLRYRESYNALKFSSYGFPLTHPESESAHGQLGYRVGLEWLRVESDSTAIVEHGFSGAAVWDNDGRGVVAMIVTRKTDDGRVAYAMPLTIVAKRSPVVAEALYHASTPLGWLDRTASSLEADMISFRKLIGERTDNFVGREFVFTALNRRLADPQFSAGYVLICGEPGIGKTAVIAQLAQTQGCVHHFNIVSENVRSPAQFLRSACAQLIARYDLPFKTVPPYATENSKTLESLLEMAVKNAAEKREQRVVLLVDALDEAEAPGVGVNWLSLPRTLPAGAYVVASVRKNVEFLLTVDQRADDILLEANSSDNLNDIKNYIGAFLDRYWDETKSRLAEWDKTRQEFIEIVALRSEGNFMYLRYILPDIRTGKITKDSLAHLEELPQGLETYYKRHWHSMRNRKKEHFNRLQRPILCVLATAREAVTAEVVTQWINDSKKFPHVEETEVLDVLEEWAEFLQIEPENRFRIYHSSFREFLQRLEGLKPYLQAVAAAMRGKLNWDAP